MVYEQKHIDHPMSLLETKRRQGGRYGYKYFDMDGILQRFFPIFTAPGADIFVRLITGWVLCTRRRTITGMLPFADPLGFRAHDAYHRFLPDALAPAA